MRDHAIIIFVFESSPITSLIISLYRNYIFLVPTINNTRYTTKKKESQRNVREKFSNISSRKEEKRILTFISRCHERTFKGSESDDRSAGENSVSTFSYLAFNFLKRFRKLLKIR